MLGCSIIKKAKESASFPRSRNHIIVHLLSFEKGGDTPKSAHAFEMIFHKYSDVEMIIGVKQGFWNDFPKEWNDFVQGLK